MRTWSRRLRAPLAALALAVLVAASGWLSGPLPSTPDTAAAAVGGAPNSRGDWSGSPTPAGSPSANAAATPSSAATANCASTTFARLTEDERIGQVFIVGLGGSSLDSATIASIKANHFGSFWLANNRTGGVAPIRSLTSSIQALAPSATAGIPFLVAADQEGGYVQRLSGSGFSTIPTALTQGSYSLATLRADAQTWGRQLASAGINLDLAPVMDVVPPGMDASNPPIGQLEREYGHDPTTAGTHGAAFLEGMSAAGIATSLKHFPGLGRVTANTDYATGVVDNVTTMTDPYLGSFQYGINAGADFVMISLATYTKIDPNHLAVFSPTVMSTLLRNRLGFTGPIVSDSLTATQVAGIDPGTRAISFLSAGGDLVLVDTTSVAGTMAAAVRARVASDSAFRARVDDAALRVLNAKAARGMLRCSDAVFDVTGYFAPGSGGATYVPLDPNRLVDSRSGTRLGLASSLSAGSPASFQVTGRDPTHTARNVPSSAIAVTGNLTVTGQTAGGYVSLTPAAPSGIPAISTVNVPAGDTRANGVTVALGSGGRLWATFTAAAGARADIVFDVTGYFAAGSGGATYVPLDPNRLVDSRSGTRLGLTASLASGSPASFQVTGRDPTHVARNVPSSAIAITGNLTVTGQSSRGYFSLTPAAPSGIPAISTLNFPTGDTRANGVTVRLGSGGRLWVTFIGTAGAHADVVFDVTGYFAPGSGGATYVPLTPNRLVDSRAGTRLGLAASLSSGIPASFAVTGRSTDPAKNVPSAAIAITGNLTATNETSRGYFSLTPTAPSGIPAISTLNFPAGDTRANGVTVQLGSGGRLWLTFMGS